MAEKQYHGSCLCGDVSYDITGSPEKVFICYCSDCVKNSGAPYQTCAKFDKTQIRLRSSGQSEPPTKTWTIKNTISGFEKHKVFCATCGCTLWTIPMHHAGNKFIVRIALIDGGAQDLVPTAEFFASDKPSYVQHLEGAQQFATMPGH